MPLFSRNSIFGGVKDKPASRPPSIIATPQSPPPPPKRAATLPAIPQRPEIVHHSTLHLLEKLGLRQEPQGYWDEKLIFETPPSRNEKGRRVFEPESSSRQAENRQRREIKKREAERQARSQSEEWLEGPAQDVAKAEFDFECVAADLRDAARWGNVLVEARENRNANKRNSWFGGKEVEEERKYRLAMDVGLRSVKALEWTRELEPQTESSAASIRSSRRISSGTFMSLASNRDSRFSMLSSITTDNRQSILSTSTARSRSSVMSLPHGGSPSLCSPISSYMPSPVISEKDEDEWLQKEQDASQADGQPPLSALPPPLLST